MASKMKLPNENKMILVNSLSKGGIERVAVNLLHHLNFDYICLIDHRDTTYPVAVEKLLSLNSPSSTSLLKKSINLIVRFFRLKRIKKRHRISISLSLGEPANLLNVLTKSGDKAIISFRSHYGKSFSEDPFFGEKGSIKRKFIIFMYRIALRFLYNHFSDLMIAISEHVKKDLIENFGIMEEKIKVIYNPIDLESIENLIKEKPEFCFESAIVTVGRLTYQKGQWYLIRIYSRLKKEFPELKLLILGDGELKDYLIELSEGLGLRTYVWDRDSLSEGYDVYFLGFQKNPFKYVASSKLFVFPSLYEGFPNALLEAMACGVPVISSDCRSGPREILAPDTPCDFQTDNPEYAKYGILMPVFDGKFRSAHEELDEKEKLWLKVIRELLINGEIRQQYSEMDKKRVKDLSMEKIKEEWIKALNQLHKR
ncbi:MAG: glycosyltransferase [Geminocystis sp.]|nr:glycosyltransferase [Geminocystis sp.]